MEDLQRQRDEMVKTQLMARGIKDLRVLEAMGRIPRHLFVPEYEAEQAYSDMAVLIEGGQTISQPYMVALMTELLELKGSEKVFEVGTGTGYQAALLAELTAEVYSIERIPALAEKADARLRSLGYRNIHVIVGDGSTGLPEKAPFDRIIITAASPKIPDPLITQLNEGGIIVAPVGERFSQMLIKAKKEGGVLREEYSTSCTFVPLIGEHGWHE